MAGKHSETVLVLDAMGVLFPMGEDIDDLLVPFIAEAGGSRDRARIRALYTEASLGRLSSGELWQGVGLDLSHEDRYLERFDLTPGLMEFLRRASQHFAAIACLSNDVSDWARKRRERFGLGATITEWVISGEVGYRKPGPEIYGILLKRLRVEPRRVLFVDDRVRNLDAARALGLRTVLYPPLRLAEAGAHAEVESLMDIVSLAGTA